MIIQEWKEQIFRVWISWGYDLPFRLLNNASVKSFNLVKSSVYGKVGAVIYFPMAEKCKCEKFQFWFLLSHEDFFSAHGA
jgi:hypothetical protein